MTYRNGSGFRTRVIGSSADGGRMNSPPARPEGRSMKQITTPRASASSKSTRIVGPPKSNNKLITPPKIYDTTKYTKPTTPKIYDTTKYTKPTTPKIYDTKKYTKPTTPKIYDTSKQLQSRKYKSGMYQ